MAVRFGIGWSCGRVPEILQHGASASFSRHGHTLILASDTRMPVMIAEDDQQIRPRHVYVAPAVPGPQQTLTAAKLSSGGQLAKPTRLSRFAETRSLAPPRARAAHIVQFGTIFLIRQRCPPIIGEHGAQ